MQSGKKANGDENYFKTIEKRLLERQRVHVDDNVLKAHNIYLVNWIHIYSHAPVVSVIGFGRSER